MSAQPPLEPEVSSAPLPDPKYLWNEELVQIVERLTASCFTKIRAAEPYIKELRDRFARRPRGSANIAGCKTWKEFCETRLNRCDRTIRLLLASSEQKTKTNRGRKKKTQLEVLDKLSELMDEVWKWPTDRPLGPVIAKLREYAAQLETLERKRAAERHAEAKRILKEAAA